jgi:hypothetical protein
MAKQQSVSKDKVSSASVLKANMNETPFIFDRTNYFIMIAGIVVILLGFVLMSGGSTTDPNVFPKEELYSFRRITLAPIVVMIGFAIEIYAILKRPKL